MRRKDIPWEELERLYVQGEIPPNATKVTERVWPSLADLAPRFKLPHPTLAARAKRDGWTVKREEWKRTLRTEVDAQTARYIENASEILGTQAAQVVLNTTLLLQEIEYTARYYRELLPASPDKSPFADVSEPLVPPPEAPDAPKVPKPRRPIPSRTVQELSNAQRTLYETLRLVLGVSASQASPGSGAHNREESAVTTPAPAPDSAIPIDLQMAVVDLIAERNKAPKKDGG